MPLSRNRKVSPGLFYAIAGILALLSTTTAEEVVPGYSVKYQAISALGGAGYPTMIYWDAQIFIIGLLWITGTRLLFRQTKYLFTSIPFYLVGVGLILVSLNPWNINPALHMIGAEFAAIFGALSALLSYKITKNSLKYTSFSLGALSFFGYFFATPISFILGPGGAERLIYYPIFFWAILFGGVLVGKNSTLEGINFLPEKDL